MNCEHIKNERVDSRSPARWCPECGAIFRPNRYEWELPQADQPAATETGPALGYEVVPLAEAERRLDEQLTRLSGKAEQAPQGAPPKTPDAQRCGVCVGCIEGHTVCDCPREPNACEVVK